jgi:hypothetical protein
MLDQAVTRRLDKKKDSAASKACGTKYRHVKTWPSLFHSPSIRQSFHCSIQSAKAYPLRRQLPLKLNHLPPQCMVTKITFLLHSLRFPLHWLPVGLLFVSRIRNFFPAKMQAPCDDSQDWESQKLIGCVLTNADPGFKLCSVAFLGAKGLLLCNKKIHICGEDWEKCGDTRSILRIIVLRSVLLYYAIKFDAPDRLWVIVFMVWRIAS